MPVAIVEIGLTAGQRRTVAERIELIRLALPDEAGAAVDRSAHDYMEELSGIQRAVPDRFGIN